MTQLETLLNEYRSLAQNEREKGTYFEQLVQCYLKHEPCYADLYSDVWMYADWAKSEGTNAQDVGIDLVARARDGQLHAIQCKLYAADYKLQKSDIDSFFTASGKKCFSHRIIVSTTNAWSPHAEEALRDQQPPVTKIDLHDLEASQIDWSRYQPKKPVALKAKKTLRQHQQTALREVKSGLATADRGKLIMACGTGKTLVALKIAEAMAGKNGRVLFLVPSLSLLSQTLTEWTQETEIPLHSFAVCSDSDVGKKRASNDDLVPVLSHELRYPATTDAKSLANAMEKRHDRTHMSVVFSTYHSIDVISKAQKKHGLADFDLIICDEAHRTTGAIFESEEESAFVRVHDADYLHANKRLYMTATPRIYADSAKAVAERDNVALCSMDDPALYGELLHVLTFSNAVKAGLLVDYKVVVLSVEENHVNRRLQTLWKDENNQLKVDDAARIVGCWKALSKQGLEDLMGDKRPMQRAVAFCQVIERGINAKTHKVSSKNIASMFQKVVDAYQEHEKIEPLSRLQCEARHVDGTMNASQKEEKLVWLKANIPDKTCRILSNVRCLSEGVDVPALDAVLFLTPRNSQVDVVQSVGRVMRNAPGKNRGYVILPVVIPAGVEPHDALNDNKTYAVVWQVLQALRSHDDRFDAMVNKMDLDLNRKMLEKMEVISITDKIPAKRNKTTGVTQGQAGRGGNTIGQPQAAAPQNVQHELPFEIGEIERAIYAKVVQKCGNRHHWEDWANDIAKIAGTHIDRITAVVEDTANAKERKAFFDFAAELRDDLNDSVSDGEIIEMLAQHLITKPVFDSLFSDYAFASQNPISQAMQGVLEVLQKHRLDKEADTLEAFYESVRERAKGIDNAEGKQKIVAELYDKFFRNAFPKMTKRLGIVYTPVEVVDFIIHSVDYLLRNEFGQTIGSKGVHVIDPFTGTGTFITRLLQSGLVKPEELSHKYRKELHANEIVLLAYYIAAINIEAVYHSLVGDEYVPFEGICLTDTFQLYEKDDLISRILVDNSARRSRQKKLEIRVIIGNPPYSSGDKDDENNKSIEYRSLDQRISETYVGRSSKRMGKSKSYDSYKRAIRWASDRVGKSGIVGFVTGAGFLEASTDDGLRRCLVEEFSSIYVLHLRGDQRTSGEQSRKEGGKIFGSASRAPIAISFLVKNPDVAPSGRILFHDIGDYLTREEKLRKLNVFHGVGEISAANAWRPIIPDAHGDWLTQRDDGLRRYIPMGDKSSPERISLFETYSMGIKTNRDAWTYNFSKVRLTSALEQMIAFFNSEVDRYQKGSVEGQPVEDFVSRDKTRIKWTSDVLNDLAQGRRHAFVAHDVVRALYRPFSQQWVYSNKNWNWTRHLMPHIFPDATAENLVIQVNASYTGYGNFALISSMVTDLHCTGDSQCFPLYLYEDAGNEELDLFGSVLGESSGRVRRDGITDEGLAHFRAAYPLEKISKEDIFYYVYGLLHSPDYRKRFADNLSKELPRIPCVKQVLDFWAFSKAGRDLAELHLNYETVPPHPVQVAAIGKLPESAYRVEQMRYGKAKVDGKVVEDKTVLIYNDNITLKGIPIEAYEYVVNGKPALDWVVERQSVNTDKKSGIVNDANDWATETMGNAKYPLEVFQRVITVSLETLKIVASLPALEI